MTFRTAIFKTSGSKIYTTLDPDLQRDAAESVAIGMREVDALLAKRHKEGTPVEEPQVALICLDPHTGEVKALIGGKNYGVSQLDHVVAKRPSGSVFKPFVYAAALNTASLGPAPIPLPLPLFFRTSRAPSYSTASRMSRSISTTATGWAMSHCERLSRNR